jgi:hypothetical protein
VAFFHIGNRASESVAVLVFILGFFTDLAGAATDLPELLGGFGIIYHHVHCRVSIRVKKAKNIKTALFYCLYRIE